MDERTKKWIREQVEFFRGDREHTARWISRTLHVCGIKAARALIAEALS